MSKIWEIHCLRCSSGSARISAFCPSAAVSIMGNSPLPEGCPCWMPARPLACTRLRSPGLSRPTRPCRRARRSGWPSARPTCSGSATPRGRSGRARRLRVRPRAERRSGHQDRPRRGHDHLRGPRPTPRSPHGLMPLVVPQLKTITLGGAVTGLGIESTSLRNGLPHESVTEMEILTGDGRVVVAAATTSTPTCSAASRTPTARSATPCRSPSSSSRSGPTCTCATSGSTAPKPAWRPSARSPPRAATTATGWTSSTGPCSRPDELYLTVGAYSDVAPWRSDYTGQQIYYRSVRGPRRTSSPSATTCGAGTPTGSGARGRSACRTRWSAELWPRRYRRSDVYRKLVALDRRYGLTDALTRQRRRPPARR